jgi:hypothetical protein
MYFFIYHLHLSLLLSVAVHWTFGYDSFFSVTRVIHCIIINSHNRQSMNPETDKHTRQCSTFPCHAHPVFQTRFKVKYNFNIETCLVFSVFLLYSYRWFSICLYIFDWINLHWIPFHTLWDRLCFIINSTVMLNRDILLITCSDIEENTVVQQKTDNLIDTRIDLLCLVWVSMGKIGVYSTVSFNVSSSMSLSHQRFPFVIVTETVDVGLSFVEVKEDVTTSGSVPVKCPNSSASR